MKAPRSFEQYTLWRHARLQASATLVSGPEIWHWKTCSSLNVTNSDKPIVTNGGRTARIATIRQYSKKGKGNPRTSHEGPELYSFFILWLDGASNQHQAPAAVPPKKRSSTHFTRSWVGPGPIWTGAENSHHRDFFWFSVLHLYYFFCPYSTTQTSMPPAGFEPATSASDRLQTLALDHSATGIGGFEPRTIQPVASRYTDWAIPAYVSATRNLNSLNSPVPVSGWLDFCGRCSLEGKNSPVCVFSCKQADRL